MQPIDILKNAELLEVPGFEKASPRCCAYCAYHAYLFPDWVCLMYNLSFGDSNEQRGFVNAVEFVCDTFRGDDLTQAERSRLMGKMEK